MVHVSAHLGSQPVGSSEGKRSPFIEGKVVLESEFAGDPAHGHVIFDVDLLLVRLARFQGVVPAQVAEIVNTLGTYGNAIPEGDSSGYESLVNASASACIVVEHAGLGNEDRIGEGGFHLVADVTQGSHSKHHRRLPVNREGYHEVIHVHRVVDIFKVPLGEQPVRSGKREIRHERERVPGGYRCRIQIIDVTAVACGYTNSSTASVVGVSLL